MGKFQGIVSKFLATVLGSHWPVAPEKCACLLQIETGFGLAWLCDFHLPFTSQVEAERGQEGDMAGRPCPSMPSLAQVTQCCHHSPRDFKVDLIFCRSSCSRVFSQVCLEVETFP